MEHLGNKREAPLYEDSPQELYARGEYTMLELELEIERQLEAGLDGDASVRMTRGAQPVPRELPYVECSNPNCSEPSLDDGFCALPHGRREAREAGIRGWRNPCIACGTREQKLLDNGLCQTCALERTLDNPGLLDPHLLAKTWAVPQHHFGQAPPGVSDFLILQRAADIPRDVAEKELAEHFPDYHLRTIMEDGKTYTARLERIKYSTL
jgi:hypothetical protein